MQINPIRTDASNDFAHESFRRRLPTIAREIKTRNPRLTPAMKEGILALITQLKSNVLIPPPSLTAPDAQTWLEEYEKHKGDTWQSAEWFFAETYFFHLINEIVRYWDIGSDPYIRQKRASIEYHLISHQLEAALAISGSPEERLSKHLELSLWGNRADLSLPEVMKTQGKAIELEDLLVDDRKAAIERLLNHKGTVHLITDNFGAELIMDLALANLLLQLSIPVIFHVKMHPTYVSDAIRADVISLLGYFQTHAYVYAHNLQSALDEGLFRIAPNFFWNSPYFLNKLPSHLMQLFSDANLVILKGDANYRRAFFDTIWPVDTPANEIVNYLPTPLLCLRTLKSDCLAGVPKELAAKAEAANPKWRVLGKYGVIQYISS
jgi:hypothetical protein